MKDKLSSIEIYTKQETKTEVSEFCSEVGISMSGYFNMLHELFKTNPNIIKEQLCKKKTK